MRSAHFLEPLEKALPETEIMLGCARPLGWIQKEIDPLAIDAGLNGIAYPAEGTVPLGHGSMDSEPHIIIVWWGNSLGTEQLESSLNPS
jgi:Uncharacterized homolog of biotin synthetase